VWLVQLGSPVARRRRLLGALFVIEVAHGGGRIACITLYTHASPLGHPVAHQRIPAVACALTLASHSPPATQRRAPFTSPLSLSLSLPPSLPLSLSLSLPPVASRERRLPCLRLWRALREGDEKRGRWMDGWLDGRLMRDRCALGIGLHAFHGMSSGAASGARQATWGLVFVLCSALLCSEQQQQPQQNKQSKTSRIVDRSAVPDDMP
jgi:hypothetical protein